MSKLVSWIVVGLLILSSGYRIGLYVGKRWEQRRFDDIDTGKVKVHVHDWGEWQAGIWRNDGSIIQLRQCETCGAGEMREVPKVK